MPTWICIVQRIVVDVRVPIETLRIPGFRHGRVRTDRPPQHGVVPAGAGVVEPQPLLPWLPGEAAAGGQGAARARRRGGSILRLVSGSKFQVAGWSRDYSEGL